MRSTKLVCLTSIGLLLCSEIDVVSNDQPHLAEERGHEMIIREGPQFTETLTLRDARGPVLFDSASLALAQSGRARTQR